MVQIVVKFVCFGVRVSAFDSVKSFVIFFVCFSLSAMNYIFVVLSFPPTIVVKIKEKFVTEYL